MQKMSDFNAYNRRKLANQARVENAIKQQVREEQTRKGKAAKAEAVSERAAMEDTARDESVVSMVESSRGSYQSIATQTELSVLDIEYMETRACEVRVVRESVLIREFLGSGSSKVPDLIKFYTGLPSYPRLMVVYDYVSSSLVKNASSALPLFQQFLISLMKLRLNISDQDIAYLFGISQSAVSKNLRKWVNIMYIYLKPFIVWPGHEEVMKTMPEVFKREFKRCICIIDCFEVFCERPSGLMARAQTYSNYKSNSTIGVDPTLLFALFQATQRGHYITFFHVGFTSSSKYP